MCASETGAHTAGQEEIHLPLHMDDNKHVSLSLSEPDRLCPVAKALASPMRVRMIGLLCVRPMNVNELAEALSLPVSTAALNVRQLEDAGLITSEIQPGVRGAMKLCSRRIDSVSMRLTPEAQEETNTTTFHLPIGSYSAAEGIKAECGMVSGHAWIGESNAPRTFYHPDRLQAQMLWFSSGELEYRIAPAEIDLAKAAFIEFSMELSSNAPLYRGDYKSDIYVSVNGTQLGVWTCPGDFGGRRGRLNPSWWSDTSSQYGLLKTWRVDETHTTLNGEHLSSVTLADLKLNAEAFISLRVGVSPQAEHVGGLNLFGEKFGDYGQGIVMRVGYRD